MPQYPGPILDAMIAQTPWAVIDFETTGLQAGPDRIIEATVIRVEPGTSPQVVFDSLINPHRSVGATEIHGIRDQDVADAPAFNTIVDALLESLDGAIVASYNASFDIRFLEMELDRCDKHVAMPYACLMYMRPMLQLGERCRLDVACRDHAITLDQHHAASADAMASAQLLQIYLSEIAQRGIRSFKELKKRKSYKFCESWEQPLFVTQRTSGRMVAPRLKSRRAVATPPSTQSGAMRIYWEALKSAMADLSMQEIELTELQRVRDTLGLSVDRIRALHAKAFASVIAQLIDDQAISDRETLILRKLHACLSAAGYAPGQ